MSEVATLAEVFLVSRAIFERVSGVERGVRLLGR